MRELKQNFLDRIIAYVFPGMGARRMHARYCMSAASGLVTGARRMAGGHDGTLANWNPRRDQRLSESTSFDRAMLRAESLASNDGHAASAIDALALNVVGSGLRPQSYPDAKTLGVTEEQAADFAESAERAWALWCREADAAEILHFDDLQYQAIRSMFVTGEFLHLVLWREDSERTFGLCLQSLHPARLRTPSDMQSRTDIRNGVHLGEYGQPKGYLIANPPENMGLSGLSSAYFQYVPRKTGHRWNCLHRFHAAMPEEARGVSVLSPAMKQFRDLADYVDYELVGALIAASFTVFIETPADVLGGRGGFDGTNSMTNYSPQIQPGTMTLGQAGHKPHIISSTRPGPTFDAFYERVLRAAAASTGQPYELVAKDFSKTNYSSARAALLEVWKLHALYQEWLVRGYLNCLWPMVIEEAWLRGLLSVPPGAPGLWDSPLMTRAWLSCIWTRPPRGQIDPTKEREAEALGLASMTDTRTAICHGRGLDFETVAKTRQREERLLQRLGLHTEAESQTTVRSQPPQENGNE